MDHDELIPHLFRKEYSRIIAVLCRKFGFEHLSLAEDVASETFLIAAQTWPMKGIPANPGAWLYTVSTNRFRNELRRKKMFDEKISPQLRALSEESFDADLTETSILDSQLQMMFALCHPALAKEAQVALCLRILCGFGIEEIASAFMSNKETISKRLMRAKQRLREQCVSLEMPTGAQLVSRIDSVLSSLYLLFNEGYYSRHNDAIILSDLCWEAIRLCKTMTEFRDTDVPAPNALLALMCFQASRLDARKGTDGQLILLDDQDRSLWNTSLVQQGAYHLFKASTGNTLSEYHLEAAIAYWTMAPEDNKHKWTIILDLFDKLIGIKPSPVVALNRLYSLSRAKGKQTALKELIQSDLPRDFFYHALLADFNDGIDSDRCRESLHKALKLASTEPERTLIRKKLAGSN